MPLKRLHRLVWTKHESYILQAESLRLVWTNYENYILHTSAIMYTFQNLTRASAQRVMNTPSQHHFLIIKYFIVNDNDIR